MDGKIDEIAGVLTNWMEEMQEFAKHRQSLKGCYLLFEDIYLQGKTSVFILIETMQRNRASFIESLREDKLVKN